MPLAVSTVLLLTLPLAARAQNPSVLTPRLLHRLQLDRQRQTVRWSNFESRVQSVPDSPQRGFELALYYAITRNESRGREAIDWALTHPCDPLQTPYVLDWTSDLLSNDQRHKIPACPPTSPDLLASLENGAFRNARTLYAACQYLLATRLAQHTDLRQNDPHFFSQLPIEFLLSLKPAQVEHPDWITHIAALALIALDPNLDGSQYLQAWAIEDRQMIRDGPGVAYEFFWADPYLPGVGYQNLDPWIYDTAGRLFARSTWDPDACWIALSPHAIEQENCPPNWRDAPASFGRMTLIPITARCADLPPVHVTQSVLLWRLPPGEPVSYRDGNQTHSARADAAGLLPLYTTTQGKVCRAR